MSSVCISKCVKDTRIPLRSNYVNLHKQQYWPESAGMVDSISCRQLYLRSAYTFSRKETVPQKTNKCLGRVKERVTSGGRLIMTRPFQRRRKKKFLMVKRVKEFSCEAFSSIFHKLLSCTATVDVVEQKD